MRNWNLITRQIQTTQFYFIFPPSIPTFKALIISESEKNSFTQLYSENLAGIKASLAMLTIGHYDWWSSKRDTLSLFLEIFEQKEEKLHYCNEFPNESAVSVSRSNAHSSQKQRFLIF